MVKCFLTGIEIEIQTAMLLDRGATVRAVLNLKQRLAALERLLAQLGPADNVELFDYKAKTQKVRSQRRLVCPTVGDALSASCPESRIFMTWKEFVKRKPVRRPISKATGPGPAAANPSSGKLQKKSPSLHPGSTHPGSTHPGSTQLPSFQPTEADSVGTASARPE